MSEYALSSKKLEGKVAIVTGGASGIGEATARHFADHGARTVVIADIQEEKGIEVATSIGSHRCTFVKCDVSDEQQVKSLVESTVQMCGQLDIMFSNAGVVSMCKSKQSVLDFDLNGCDELFAVNVRGTLACVKHAARAMVEGGVKGSIVCTGSVAATTANSVSIDYSMSKMAVVGLVRSASKALGEHGIRINCVSPGAVGTPLLCNRFRMSEQEVEKTFESLNCLKGVGAMKAKDVADSVLFLVSEDSKFMTGHNMIVDAGFTPP